MEWLEYPAEFRLPEEEKNNEEATIIIGTDKEDITLTKWNGTFVIERDSDLHMINFKFSWKETNDFPENAPTVDISKVPDAFIVKFKNALTDSGQLKEWNPSSTIKANLKKVLTKL